MDNLNEDGYYLQACSWLNMGENDKAYASLKQGAINLDQPSRNMLRLCSYVAIRIQPPRFMEAVDSFSSIIKINPQDFDAVSQLVSKCSY